MRHRLSAITKSDRGTFLDLALHVSTCRAG
jgi:hypothetical protein